MKIKGKTAFAGALFVGAVFILGTKLLNPASIQLFVEGNQTAITQIPGLFTLTDVIIIFASTLILAVSGMYLLFFDTDETGSKTKKTGETKQTNEWEKIIKTLEGDEKMIYQKILSEEGIMYQSELVTSTGFAKAKVTRCLDALEHKGLLERKRKGMGNLVLLK
ncbi:hypothetical protein BEH94_01515 [Candidatus Altiarchaeales archaeon WOR_SM1_SCG]|nr:hypothetical protein BEH94_01515 [Candidatus Altiarchaeales archaeon WOR_SM1_SCG]